MSTASTARTQRGPHVSNPLSLFGLFLSLCQVTIGVAAVQTSGWVQGLFAVFAVVFPLVVLAAFFAVLWDRPQKLYPPGDYNEGTPVGTYTQEVNAVTNHRRVREEAEEEVLVRKTARYAAQQVASSGVIDTKLVNQDEIVDTAVRETTQHYRSQLLTVDLSSVDEHLETPLTTSITSKTLVTDVLDRIYFAIHDYVPANAYGLDWELIDTSTGTPLPEMGGVWAHPHHYDEDLRPAERVGLRPGTRLSVRLLKRSYPS